MRVLVVGVVSGLAACVTTLALVFLWFSPETRDPEAAPSVEAPPEAVNDGNPISMMDTGRADEERAQIASSVRQIASRLDAMQAQLGNVDRRLQELEHTDTASGIAALSEDTQRSEGIVEALPDTSPPIAERSLAENLQAAGMAAELARDIESRSSQFQLARLELIDQATRENWADTEAFDARLDELEQSRPDLRNELGDDSYDRYLFESGRNNRIAVASVIAGSAASVAGLQPGDVVSGYAGSRLFRVGELQAATREGNRGDIVQLDVLRDGARISLPLPRGPLGITLTGSRQVPDG